MYGILLTLIFSVIGGLSLWVRTIFFVGNEAVVMSFSVIGFLALVVAAVVFAFWLFNLFWEINGQRMDVENVKNFQRKMKAVKRQLRDQEPVLRKILAERFPEIEESLFKSIKAQGDALKGDATFSGIAVDYPEIRSIEGLTRLVDELMMLYTRYYKHQRNIMDTLTKMRKRRLDLWIIQSLIAEVPADLEKLDDEFECMDEAG